MRPTSCYAACILLLLVSASLQAHANAVAQVHRGARSMSLHGLVRQLQELGGVKGLSEAEVSAILTRLQQVDPEAFAGKNVTELRQELASVDLSALGMDPSGLSAATKLQAVTSELLDGLNATAGAPGQPAPTPPEAAFNITPLSPPEDCPGWGCVCADKPAQAKVVAPDNCQAFITCDGKGNGSKALCPIAGTGFSPDSGTCKPLDGPPDADNTCNFADSSVAAASFAKQSDDATSYSCQRLLSLGTATNLVGSSDTGVEGCTLQAATQSGRVEVRAANASLTITTVLIKYLEKGPSTPVTVSSARGAANVTSFRAHRRVVVNRASGNTNTAAVQQADVWQPRTALVSFTRPAGAAVISLAPLTPGAGILLLSVDITEGLLPPPGLPASSTAVAVVSPNATADGAGVEVPIVPGPLANFGIASEVEGEVTAQGLRGALVTLSNNKWWQRVETAVDIAGYLNTKANEVMDAIDLANYRRTYQNALVGASQCYRHSYGRGVGHIPENCHGWQNIGGVCYEWCRHNYYDVWFVCWERCPGGFEDHGVTCHRPMHSYWNENRGWCGWWDICATWSRTDCRVCNDGYRRDGCVCTRPPVWHTKHTYTRSSFLPSCWNDRQMQNGLCYSPCAQSYWGEGPMCYNECPDAFPHSCGLGLCTKDATACGRFVANAVINVLSLVFATVSAVVTGGATAVAGALQAAAETAQFFGDTKSCGDSRIHHASRLAIMHVPNREFQGNHVAVFDGANWDGCLVRCSQRGDCKAVVFNRNIGNGRCHLLSQVSSGPHGRNAHAPGVDTAVAIMRMEDLAASWQFSVGHQIMFRGTVLSVGRVNNQDVTVITHKASNTGSNLAICQLSCVEQNCDFIAYSSKYCFVMNRGGNTDPRDRTSDEKVHSVMVNMAKWHDWDANGNYPSGI